ncbi:MAG TPA: hypothetical protein PK395_08225 [bacterium]|nr:hypothetical protein [bacterium]
MAEGRTPPTREQLVAYIRKLEKRVKFLETELAEHKRSGESTNGLNAVQAAISVPTATGQAPKIIIPPKPVPAAQPDKPPTFVIGKKPLLTPTPAPAPVPKAEIEEPKPRLEGPVDLGVGPAAAAPEVRDIMDIDEEAPPAPVSEGAAYPHPQNEPVVIPIPDILPPAFKPGEFTRQVLNGEDEDIVDPMLRSLDQLKTCPPEERRNVFSRMTSIFWTAVDRMGKRTGSGKLSWPKRLFMRFGIIDPDLLSNEIWRTLYNENSSVGDTGIYYVDEWLEAIYGQEIKYSAIDEMALQGGKAKKDASGEECVGYELINVPQMQRMVVGPRANLIAILTSDYCTPSRDNPLLTREWVYRTVKMLVPFDYTMFQRKYKGEDIEVKPLWLILPGYGTRAACWEPWSPGFKRTGPRLLICLFPPRASLKTLIDGLSDFRWTFAKEDAMHYWLTEGLTGKFLGMFSMKEQRQDMKALFRSYYRDWMLNEPRRVPKLDKKIREFFYHNCPYSDEVKQTLRSGGLFMRMIELEMAKRERDEKEKEEIERIKAMREAKKAMRQAKLEEGG